MDDCSALNSQTEPEAREEILRLTRAYARRFHGETPFRPEDKIPYAKRVYGEEEMANLVDSALTFWLTAGEYAAAFESDFAAFLGLPYCALCNSGSSANLLSFMALTSPELGERAVRRGDEIITVAAGFPTTVAPIVQFGAVPVFVDVTIPQYNVDISALEPALSPKTKAVMLAHTLGNPFDLAAVRAFCDAHNLWLIEDNCDALGTKTVVNGQEVYTGTVGDLATSSFYPPHHMTMGEGGAVYTRNAVLHRIVVSLRDWGRDCVCPPGHDNACGHRFDGQYGALPAGYDHKYVYSHFGYNLKATDMQAAVGLAQLRRLPGFIESRRAHFRFLYEGLAPLAHRLILPAPLPGSTPSWFGFPVTCRGDFREKLVRTIEANGVQTRMLFAGNLIRHPCFDALRGGAEYRVAGKLSNTDRIMRDTFWVGVYPGLTEPQLARMVSVIEKAAALL